MSRRDKGPHALCPTCGRRVALPLVRAQVWCVGPPISPHPPVLVLEGLLESHKARRTGPVGSPRGGGNQRARPMGRKRPEGRI
jgi:hypothetical protein